MHTFTKFAALAVTGALAFHWLSQANAGTQSSPEASDHRLRERIRGQLGRMVRQPEEIEVVVNAGDVSLRGGLFASEADQVLNAVLAMPGVKHINNRLALRDDV